MTILQRENRGNFIHADVLPSHPNYKAKPFKYSGSRFARSWNFLNQRSNISIGTTSLLPSTPQNDCIKLNKFSPTFSANLSIFCPAATSREGSVARSSTETPIFAEIGVASAVSCSCPPGSGQGSDSTAEGRVSVTAPQKRKGEPGDWIYTARALSGGSVKLLRRNMQTSRIESYASPAHERLKTKKESGDY
ncbi:hypothetical protein H5410_029323 [Solanum commersonii]|uniref:Uncharacterized protein n=1 Tax=Solanum commersonii TaxID=4109 RepID=A0A9J5Z7E8_SOLCO|nr:hypothetical protein H5410_029323 [Solanum commersonii]